MIHDTTRVVAIRARVAAQIDLIKSLEGKIVKGKLDALEVARNQTEDIETFFRKTWSDKTGPGRRGPLAFLRRTHAPDMGAVSQADRRAVQQIRRSYSDCWRVSSHVSFTSFQFTI